MGAILEWICAALLGIIKVVCESLFELIAALIEKKPQSVYDARFADRAETAALLSSSYKGFTYGNKSLSLDLSKRNSLVYGSSGSGKNISVCITSIFNMMKCATLVINSPSKQDYAITSGAIHASGARIKVIDFADPTKGGYNPFDFMFSESDTTKVSELLVFGRLGQGKDQFWNLSAVQFTAICIRIVQTFPKEQRTMASVLEVVKRFSYDPATVDKICVATGNERLISAYKVFCKYEPKMLNSIIAVCLAALSIFGLPEVAACTSYDTLDVHTWRTVRTCVFIHSSIPNMRMYGPLISLMCSQLFDYVMSEIPPPGSNGIYFLLDESSSLTLGQTLPNTYSNIRKYNGGILSIYQSPFQCIELFTQAGARALEENAFCKVYMNGLNPTSGSELEMAFGKTEVIEDDHKRIQPLITAANIRLLKESLIVCTGERPIKMQLKPYFKQWRLRRLAKLPPYVVPNQLPFDTVPTIQF